MCVRIFPFVVIVKFILWKNLLCVSIYSVCVCVMTCVLFFQAYKLAAGEHLKGNSCYLPAAYANKYTKISANTQIHWHAVSFVRGCTFVCVHFTRVTFICIYFPMRTLNSSTIVVYCVGVCVYLCAVIYAFTRVQRFVEVKWSLSEHEN